MSLIGLLGKKSSGKSTAADYLVEKYQFHEKSFADPLKIICRELFLLNDDQLYGDLKEIPDPRWYQCSPRKMLQFIGTDLLRNQLNNIMPGIDNDIFIDHFRLWFEREKQINPNVRVVISDNRFINEVEFIKSLGGIIIKINRPLENDDSHQSEKQIDQITNYDYCIENIGTLEDFYLNLDKIVVDVVKN